MKNKWMKSKVMNNFGLKVISLVVAFIVWLVIINTTNPTITKTFTDIPVKVINENVITSLNQVYEVVDGNMVDVVVKGKRSFVEELTNDDFSAENSYKLKIKVGQQIFNAKFLFPTFFICDTASRHSLFVKTVCNVKTYYARAKVF